MDLSCLYRSVRRVLEALRVHWSDTTAKDAVTLVLRDRIAALRRQVARPRFTWSDRAVIALLGVLVPRSPLPTAVSLAVMSSAASFMSTTATLTTGRCGQP